MAGKAKPAPRRRARVSEVVIAGRRDVQRFITPRTKYQQPGAVIVYDGREFRGTVLPQAGRWVAFDASGHRIGTYELRHRAEHAIYQAGEPGGAR